MRIVRVVLSLLLLVSPGLAQSICVIDEMQVQVIRGYVTDPNGLAIAEATVELFKKGNNKALVKIATDENGYFTFTSTSPGRSEIAVRYPSLRTLYVPLRVIPKTKSEKKPQEVVVVLNGLMDKPCGGGTAYLRPQG
jgi:hypothetical protein